MRTFARFPFLMAAVLTVACNAEADTKPATANRDDGDAAAANPTTHEGATMELTSTAFGHQQSMPTKYTCEGHQVSPPLSWSDVPEGTQSFALIVDDPDAPDPAAPKRVFVHWVLYNIPADVRSLPENAASTGLPSATLQGKNDRGESAYTGPCPPIGRHRYFHKIYALDTKLDLESPTKADLERAMKGHVLATGELVGTYQKMQRKAG